MVEISRNRGRTLSLFFALTMLLLSVSCGIVGDTEENTTPPNFFEGENNSRTNGTTAPEGAGDDLPGIYEDLVAVADEGVQTEPEQQTTPNPQPEIDPIVEDDAVLVSMNAPALLSCGSQVPASITMKNTGSATWTREKGYKLGAVDDEDPLKVGDVRIWLQPEDEVLPGDEYTFTFDIKTAGMNGIFTTDWQMVHEGVQWFGETASADVEIHCEDLGPLPLPNMSAVVQAYADAHPEQLANSCQDEPGGSWDFLDGLVDLLRETDDRWGYNWKRGVVGDPSQDVLDYHYGWGEREESTEVYIIDVIVGHCGPNPTPGWGDQTQLTLDQGEIGRWTGRGRFQ